ncbi:recombinase RecA [Halobacteriales archaeon QH_7_65_31]|nr:MAG: recombinase RecA [Halobacteriales archaeon QH_7_65_31]
MRLSMSDGSGVCAFCRMSIPESLVEANGKRFCSAACRDRLAETETSFGAADSHRRIRPGVSGLDSSLPNGFPRNAFVLVASEAGTRDRALGAELVWRALQRGEPVVFTSFQEPPSAVVQQFIAMEWNVLPYLESGQLHIVDCFTYRLGGQGRDRLFDRMGEWNQYLSTVARDATTTVRDPTDVREIENKLDNALEGREMVDDGLVVIDSLTEMGTLTQPVQAYDFVKDMRADICKGRFVPIFAGAALGSGGGGGDAFPHDLTYVMDGLIELGLEEARDDDRLVKQIRIRKLNGAAVTPAWQSYEFEPRTGMVVREPGADEAVGDSSADADEESVGDSPADADGESVGDPSADDDTEAIEEENR